MTVGLLSGLMLRPAIGEHTPVAPGGATGEIPDQGFGILSVALIIALPLAA